MNFVSIRIITADIKRLAGFYEQITGIPVTMYTEDFGELKTSACTLAMGSTRTLQLFGDEVARPAENHTAILEFRVGDVDAEYRRLVEVIGHSLIQEPTTMPWGNRSLLFRDPDGNLVNFFTPISAEAIKKFAQRHRQLMAGARTRDLRCDGHRGIRWPGPHCDRDGCGCSC